MIDHSEINHTGEPGDLSVVERITALTQRRVTELFEQALRRPRLHTFGHGLVEILTFGRQDGRRGLVLSKLEEPGPIGVMHKVPPEQRMQSVPDFASILAFDNIEGVDVLIRALQTIRAEMVLDAGPAEP